MSVSALLLLYYCSFWKGIAGVDCHRIINLRMLLWFSVIGFAQLFILDYRLLDSFYFLFLSAFLVNLRVSIEL